MGTTSSTSNVFNPRGILTRAEVMTILARNAGVKDTDSGSTWYEVGVEWAKENGISDGNLPLNQIPRDQFAVLLWHVAGSPKADLSVLDKFTDAGSISPWGDDFKQGVAWAVQAGIITGQGADNDQLAPLAKTTRMEAATMFMRFIQGGWAD